MSLRLVKPGDAKGKKVDPSTEIAEALQQDGAGSDWCFVLWCRDGEAEMRFHGCTRPELFYALQKASALILIEDD